MLVFILLVFGILSRFISHFITHTPNFTPVIALALLSGAYFNKRYAVVFPLGLMILSDLVIGLHETIIFTWGSMALVTVMGFSLREQKNPVRLLNINLWSAILFFVITNFGTWLMGSHGLYPMTLAGLKECFMMAIPFFRNTLISTIAYSGILFGTYELVAQKVKSKPAWARVLLTN